MSTEQLPMDGDQWAEASTREGLMAQLRGQREAGRLALTELRECREEYHKCRAMWAKQVRELSERAVVAEDAADDLRQENSRLRAHVAAWKRWEHAWVFGGDAKYPGSPGVTDPRETLDALERLALGVPEEEADDA
ncbi:MAG TPA: hypothetical protein VM537_15405 [Anaerolineae bacterium]|nr:hypothetical protein [Anaerolineae bacterium]